MGDSVEYFRALREHNKAIRRLFGVPCPGCMERRPRANPKILLPGQRCGLDGYVDTRPQLTQAQHEEAARA